MIKFRKADHIDISTLSNLYERTYTIKEKKHSKFDIQHIQNEFYQGYISFLMYDIIKRIPWLIGAYSFHQRKNKIYVSHIAILPEYQNKGYGYKLFEHREKQMSKIEGIKYLESHILVDTPNQIKDFYESFEYKPYKTFTYNETKILKYRKTL